MTTAANAFVCRRKIGVFDQMTQVSDVPNITTNGNPVWKTRIVGHDRVDPSSLVANPLNYRTHPQAQREALSQAISQLGFLRSVTVNLRTGNLVDGHERVWLALQTEQPLIDVEYVDLSEAEEKAALATMDPISEMATVDAAKLDELLREVKVNGEALQGMLSELADTAGLYKTGEVIEDEVPEPPEDPITKPGDLWVLGEHRLLCGDNANRDNLTRLFSGSLAQLVFTSPPYNQDIGNFSKSGMHKETKWVDQTMAGSYFDNRPEEEYQQWQTDSIKAWSEFLSETASLFYNHKNRFRDKQCISPWRWLDRTGAKVRQEIIWMRDGSVTQNMRGFMPCDERIFWMYFGTEFLWVESTEHKSWSTVWRINSQKDKGSSSHGCAFPVELPARAIRACSIKDQIVFEPYSGSGTTIIAAEQLGRRCYAMEIEPRYCDVAVQRWENLTGRKGERQ